MAMDDSIVIESATATEADMVAAFGGTVTAPANDVETRDAVADKPTADVAAATPLALDAAIDQVEPPVANETSDQRTDRQTRATKRVLAALSTAKAAEERALKAEAAAKVAAEEVARLKAAPPAAVPPPAGTPKADEPPKVDLPAFTFPAWDAYSEQHPEATHEQYIDARQDARDLHKTEVKRLTDDAATRERVTREHDEQTKAVYDENARHVDAYRQAHPDYDDAMKTAMDLPLPPAMHAAMMAQKALGPAIALHLAQHRDEHLRIIALDPIEQIGEIRDIAKTLKAAQAPTPAAADAVVTPPAGSVTPPAVRLTITPKPTAPSRPLSDAPAPTSVVTGGAKPTPSLARLAAEDEDADAYIVERQRQRREMGLRR